LGGRPKESEKKLGIKILSKFFINTVFKNKKIIEILAIELSNTILSPVFNDKTSP
jgi:hypothetical protein